MEAVFEHEMAVVAILKNEGNYIKEWLDYHMSAGVTKFYLYDNESEDNLKNVLQPYIDAQIVDYMYWPGTCMQLKVYNDALKKHRFDCRYMAFIDADEFIFPKDRRTIPEVIGSIMSLDPLAGGVVINWRVFGSSGQEKKNLDLGVIERFRFRAKDDFGPNTHIKSIVNPRRVENVVHVHYADYLTGMYAIDEHGNKVVLSAFNGKNTVDRICINHYFVKSREEWLQKRSRGTADTGRVRSMKDFENHDKNDVYDDGILNYYKLRKVDKRKHGNSKQVVSLALNKIRDYLEGESVFSENVNAEVILSYWYLCKKYYLKLLEYDEEEIIEFFVGILECRDVGEVNEWEFRLLQNCLPDFFSFIKKDIDKRNAMQYILWKLGGDIAKIATKKNVNLLKTYHDTRVYINAKGKLYHNGINDDEKFDHGLPVYASLVAHGMYIFFVELEDCMMYISEFDKGGSAKLSILPQLFRVEENKNGTISIHQNNGFVSAISNGWFRIQPHNREWEQFFLEPSVMNINIGRFGFREILKLGPQKEMVNNGLFCRRKKERIEHKVFRDLCTARVDIKSCGRNCGVEVKNMLTDVTLNLEKQTPVNIDSKTVVVQSIIGVMKLSVGCIGAGILNIELRGLLRLNKDGKSLPYWITYTSVRANDNSILPRAMDVCYDSPIILKKEVQDGETLILDINWQPCMKSVKDLMLVE
ncbi:glycosyltransferase family 92 protein [Selenomonas sp. AB3002]|uniref:glycosyltransferase family 92 protein n=1 Tax=Selenomonas sp. AB3002 TaxID=1392502 RepID=UPI0006898939